MRPFIEQLAGPRVKQENKFVRPQDRRGQHREKGGGQHPGLLLQRYLCENATGEGGNPEEKRAILSAAINAAANTELRQLYQIAYSRWKEQLERESPWTKLETLQSADRLIVGLGSENVLETGIRLHHNYGLPILPGSALKGLAAHYVDQICGQRDSRFKKATAADDKAYRDWLRGEGPQPPPNYHRLLFGTTDDSGCIIFHDGWFVPDSEKEPLRLDVMTPHHPRWLDGSVPPTDFDSPTPVPFLSVAGRFLIALCWCGPKDEDRVDSLKWRDLAFDCLRRALFDWGIGGKTTSGYGKFDEDRWRQEEQKRDAEEAERRAAAKREAKLAEMSPIERSIHEFIENHPNNAAPEYIKLIEELKKSDGRWTSEEDRRAVALRIKQGMLEANKWGKKGKDADRTALIKQILGES